MIRTSFLIAALVAFLITMLSGFFLIPALRRLKFGQTILEEGPSWHKEKQGTPTMGGVMFILGIIVAVTVGLYILREAMPEELMQTLSDQSLSLGITIFSSLAYGLVGFVDDYVKVVKKRNLGLKARYKIVAQVIITAVFLGLQSLVGHISTWVDIPFIGIYDIGYFYYPLMFLGIIFLVNAVNLTDGIDGLCSSITFIVAIGFMVISLSYSFFANALFSSALAGGCVGFLFWNFYPAKVFMGDTGSMFLGGAVVGMAWAINRPEILVLMGALYIVEAMSVVIQVSYFKITKGKRIFKMSPIHHHFEMSGWSEVKIVTVFSFVTTMFVYLAYLYMYLG